MRLIAEEIGKAWGGLFKCQRCEAADIWVSGKHSHQCVKCGAEAVGGWYTVPLCQKHRDERGSFS